MSDNVLPACQEVMDAVVAANFGITASYGQDEHSLRLQVRLGELFETEVPPHAIVVSAVLPEHLGYRKCWRDRLRREVFGAEQCLGKREPTIQGLNECNGSPAEAPESN